MNDFPRRACGLVMCLLLASCTYSKNPISSPATAKVDKRLLGKWREKDSPHATLEFSIIKEPWMRFTETDFPYATTTSDSEAFCTELDSEHFLNYRHRPDTTKGSKQGYRYYMFAHYTIHPDSTLTAAPIDDNLVAKAIRSGEIKGVVKGKKSNDVKITDSSANIAAFIKRKGADLVFGGQKRVFQKLDNYDEALHQCPPFHPSLKSSH